MSWDFELPDVLIARSDGLSRILDRADAIRAEGVLVWACILMANNDLWDPDADGTAPASVLYSFDPYLRQHPEALQSIASAVYTLHDTEGERPRPLLDREIPDLVAAFSGPRPQPVGNPWLRQIQDDLLTGFRRVYGRRLPPEVTGGWCVYHTTVLLFSEHLPDRHLQSNVLPILVDPEGFALALPHDLWPER